MDSFTSQDQGTEQPTDQLTFKVGEREFNAEQAAIKINAADEHIKRIEEENANFKAQLASTAAQLEQSTKIDEALAKLNNQQQSQESQANTGTPAVSEEQIGAIASRQIQEYIVAEQAKAQEAQAVQLAQSTFQETGEKLVSMYGDKVDEVVKEKAVELGVPEASLYEMAKSPDTAKLLLQTLGTSKSANSAAPSGSFNTSSIPHGAPDRFVDYSKGITSSNVLDALHQANATY